MDHLGPRQQFGFPQGTPATQPQRFPNQMRSAEGYHPVDGYRAQLQGDALPPGAGSPLDKAEEARAAAIMQRLVTLLQNTNFTAALPAFNEPHFWSQPIDLSTRYTLPLAATSGFQTALTYQVDDGRAARIAQYGFNVVDPTFTYDGSILWRITFNGNPVPGLENIAQQRGTLVLPADTFIRSNMDQGDRIEFQVRRVTAGAGSNDIDLMFRGWTWRPLRPEDNPSLGLAF